MKQLIFIAGAFALFGTFLASHLGNNPNIVSQNSGVAREQVLTTKSEPVKKPTPELISFGEVRIPRDNRGHYSAEFRLNNLRVDGLIDTGATSIAINETQARDAGIRLSQKDFKYRVNTANGQVKAARAMIDRVTVGKITVYDVEAMVLDDNALNVTLIGMSFMNRLRGFEYQSGNLVLKR